MGAVSTIGLKRIFRFLTTRKFTMVRSFSPLCVRVRSSSIALRCLILSSGDRSGLIEMRVPCRRQPLVSKSFGASADENTTLRGRGLSAESSFEPSLNNWRNLIVESPSSMSLRIEGLINSVSCSSLAAGDSAKGSGILKNNRHLSLGGKS